MAFEFLEFAILQILIVYFAVGIYVVEFILGNFVIVN